MVLVMSNSLFLKEIKKLKDIEYKYNQIFRNNDFLEYDDVYNITNKMLPSKINFKINKKNYLSLKKQLLIMKILSIMIMMKI